MKFTVELDEYDGDDELELNAPNVAAILENYYVVDSVVEDGE